MKRITALLIVLLLAFGLLFAAPVCGAAEAWEDAEDDAYIGDPEEWEDWEDPENWPEAETAEDAWLDDGEETDELTEDGFTYRLLEDGTCAITGWLGAEDHLALPGTLAGLRVSTVADNAFAEAEIVSVSIPLEITDMGANPFVACDRLVSFEVAEGHPTLSEAGGMLFSLPDRRLIAYAGGLEEGACELPAGTYEVGPDAFAWCGQLVRVQLDPELKAIGSGAFAMCTGLTGIDLPDSIETIGASAFAGSGLERIVLPMRLMVLEDRTFFDCAELSDVWLPPGLTAIEDEVFGGCMIERITLPREISYLGANPFAGCDCLTEIVVPADHPAYAMLGSMLVDKTEMRVIACLTSVIGEFTIPEGIVSVENYAFFGCSELTDITFPSTLREIGDAGFASCMTCTSLFLNNGLERIGDLAFADCFLLEEIRIPDSVTDIGEEILDGCTSLRTVRAAEDSAIWAWCLERFLPLAAE